MSAPEATRTPADEVIAATRPSESQPSADAGAWHRPLALSDNRDAAIQRAVEADDAACSTGVGDLQHAEALLEIANKQVVLTWQMVTDLRGALAAARQEAEALREALEAQCEDHAGNCCWDWCADCARGRDLKAMAQR